MNYHLHDGGKNLGVFPLEELRSQRQRGELSGREFVWRAGMADWRPLDSVLAPKKTNRVVIVGIIAGAIVVVLMLAAVGIATRKLTEQFQRGALGRAPRTGNTRYAGESPLKIAGAPIIWDSNTVTAWDIQKRSREFRERQYQDSYNKFGPHDSPTDADSLRLIKYWIIANYGTAQEKGSMPSLTELSDKLATDPRCDDPLVLMVAGVNTIELHEGVRRFERAVAGLEHSRYPGYVRFYANIQLGDKLIEDRAARRPVLDASALQDLKEALHDGSIQPGDQNEIAEILITGWGRNFFDRNGAAVCAMARGEGKTCQWLALVLEGEYEIARAWQARGGGYASTVSENGWRAFRDHLGRARVCLTRAWTLHPEWPLAADRMIYVSLGDSGIQEMRQWFDRAVVAQIDYERAWSDLRWGLRPRWYGDLDSMLAFGVAAVNTKRFDTDVPRKFFDSVADIESEMQLPQGEHIYGREDIWPHFQGMYEGYVAHAQSEESKSGWRSAYSVVAYLAGQYPVAKAQLEALGWKPTERNLSGWHRDLSLMPLEVAARTGSLGTEIEKAEAARDQGDVAAALRRYKELSHQTSADERTATFIRDRSETLDIEQRLQAGEWVDMQPADEDFTGWRVERGNCRVLPDGSLEVESGHGGHVLYSRARVGKRFEVRGEISTERSSTTAFQGGVVLGLPEPDSWDWDAFRLKRNNDEGEIISFAEGWSQRQVYYPVKLNDRTNSFYFRFEPNKISASLNGQEIFKDVKPPANWRLTTNEMHFGLGAFNDMNITTMRYRNVQVHQLAEE